MENVRAATPPNIHVGRFQPLPMVYIEVSEIEKFCLRVFGCHGFMVRVKVIKESYKVCRIGRAVSETKKNETEKKVMVGSQMTSKFGDSRSTGQTTGMLMLEYRLLL